MSAVRAGASRPRLLYLAFYFPPTRASGVYRSRAMANHFAAAGWDVTVVTVPRIFFTDYLDSYDPSLESTPHPDIRMRQLLGQLRNRLAQHFAQEFFVRALPMCGTAAPPALTGDAEILQGFVSQNPRFGILVLKETFQYRPLIAQCL